MNAPRRRPWEPIENVMSVYVVPNGMLRESGWGCMNFVAEKEDTYIGFGGVCDNVVFEGEHFQMDCYFPLNILHIWNRKGFTVEKGSQTIAFVENKAV